MQFDAALAAPAAAQEQLLREILEANRDTAYGREYDFASITSTAEYRARVPYIRFADISDRVDRMLAGEPDVLVAGQPIFFGRTSGTTGKPKHVGYPRSTELEYDQAWTPMAAELEASERGASRHVLFVTGKYEEARTPTGIPIGSASGFVRNLEIFRDQPYFHAAPEAVFELADLERRYYLLLRHALELPLVTIGALNPSSLVLLFKKAKQFGDELREELSPAAAERLRRALAGPRFEPEVAWPTLRVLQTWKGGASRHYFSALAASCPTAKVWPMLSGSTEGMLLVPLRQSWTGGVPALASTVIEALPADATPDAKSVVPFEEIQHGEYRFAITNRRGLYRYLMDDVFTVADHHRGVPVLHFSHRLGAASSLTGEKLTEADAIAGANAALALVDATDFQVAPEWDDPPRYVLLLELASPASDAALAEALRRFEHALSAANSEYAGKRSSGRLAAPTLLILREGTFERRRREQAAGRSDAQIKIARLSTDFVDRDKLQPLAVSAY